MYMDEFVKRLHNFMGIYKKIWSQNSHYRYFTDIYLYLPIFINILQIFFHKFLHKRACFTVVIFQWKNRYFPIFRRKIGDFTDFSSAFSSRCRPKTDFSAIYRPKKPIFLSNGDGDGKSKILLKSDLLPSLLHTFLGRTFLLCTSGPFHGQSPEKKSFKQLNSYIMRNHSNS